LTLTTEAGSVVVASAPTVEVDRTRVIDAQLARLGPDVLADQFDWERFRERSTRAPDQMLVSDYLLDQRVVAGIGNEYKNEILFLERIHPATPLGAISQDRRLALIERARRLMLPNARRSGDRTTTGRFEPGAGRWVYGRAGEPCRRCRTAIVNAPIGTRQPRITYWCPECQAIP
jgi:endonuclease-8